MSAEPAPTHDASSAAAFVTRHQRGLLRWLATLGCEGHRAEEHAQDALLAGLHHAIDRLPEVEASRWLRTAARNVYFVQLRRERRRPPEVDFDALESEWTRMRADENGGEAARRALDACVDELPALDRELVRLRYEQRSSRADTARAMGLGEAGVKQALRRLRERLRLCVLGRLDADHPLARTRTER